MARDRTVVLVNARVRTLDHARPLLDRLVIEGAVIGPDDADGEHLDLGGAQVLPGFTDAHVHFPSWALARRELKLFGTRSLAEALERVAAALPRDGWLRGRGWRDEDWPDEVNREALDRVTGDVPAALRSHDGHSLWVNSAATRLAGVELGSGVLREEAAWHFFDRHAAAGPDETLAAMRDALPAAAAAGVTAIHDKDGARGAPEAFAALRDELTLRVWQSVPDVDPSRGDYVKAFMDGTLGSRTALLLDGSGVRITTTERLAELIVEAAGARMPVAVHAIGDLANREVLDAFERTEAVWRPLGLRHRIEHAQCVHPDDVQRFARLGITASVQYTHATSDRELAARLWADRLDHAYPYRALLDAGVRLAGGSDAPVEELSPLDGLRSAAEEDVPEQAALESFTVHPAWLTGEEHRRGRLSPGFDADLVVLDGDRVAATMVGGRWAHGPEL
jgi:predicted amidohydrolase YtcJ